MSLEEVGRLTIDQVLFLSGDRKRVAGGRRDMSGTEVAGLANDRGEVRAVARGGKVISLRASGGVSKAARLRAEAEARRKADGS